MSYCLNPACQKPENHDANKICQNCKTKLLLADRYRAIKPIGRGGFGRTFLAVDEYKPSKPRCVVKQFLPQSLGSNNVLKAAELFQKEALQLDEMGKHPQIPEMLAYFTQDKRQYLVQEFIEGQNLAQELAEEGAFSEQEIRQLLNDLLPVLQFIHNKGVIHRDIKPENIIRRTPSYQGGTRESQLVLVDFGVANISSGSIQKAGTGIGSAEYVASEQAEGLAIFASDIYSLGVVCIHLLTEIPPFDLFDLSENTWVWRHYFSASMSNELGQILDKMLAKSPKNRYQSADKVLADLNHKSNQATVKSLVPVKPDSSQNKAYYALTSATSEGKITGNSASDLDRVEVLPPVPISISFRTERLLLGAFAITAVFSGSFSPTSAILALGSLISLILIIFSYRFQSFPEVAKKYELISNIRSYQEKILVIEKLIKNFQDRGDKLLDKVNQIKNQQLNLIDKEKKDIDGNEQELQDLIAEINSGQSALDTAESQEIAQAIEAFKDQSIADQLAQYSIKSANVTGIGLEITNRLISAGIKTAADVEYERVKNVYRIGESRASSLVSWRKQVEAQIIEEMQNALPASQEAAIREKYNNERQSLELRKAAAEQAAVEKKDMIRKSYQQQQDLLAKRLQDVQEKNEVIRVSLEEKINKEVQKLDENHKILARLEQALDAYSQVNFGTYMKGILFFR